MKTLARQIEPHVYRIRLDSPGGLVVNVFVLTSDNYPILIDSGFPYTTPQLADGLEEIGYSLQDIKHILYTHTHIDHMGGGAALGHSIDATQHLWEGTPEQAIDDYFGWYRRHEYPSEVLKNILPDTPSTQAMIRSLDTQPDGNTPAGAGHLAHIEKHAFGDTLQLGPHTFRCVDLRGHDPFHCGWLDTQKGDLYCGDAVMRVIVPIMPHMDDDLRLWLKTMQRVQELPVDRLLPGHGMPSTLVEASFKRSEGFIRNLYQLAANELQEGLPVNPVDISNEYLGGDNSRYHARLVVFAGTTYSLFQAIAELGFIQQLPSKHWSLHKSLPDYDKFLDQLLTSSGSHG